jgi:gas vesicle protein
MRFIIGLLLGLGIGFAAAVLFAPERGRLREGAPSDEETTSEGFGENHDSMVGLRRAMKGLQEQVQEAWEEARQAAREAEKELRASYDRTVSKPKR